jgi:uncharacterized protein (DUF983 family)
MIMQRCPRCLRGPVFCRLVDMYDDCPQCAYRFGREEGYFAGAMYVSYTIGLVVVFALIGILWPFWPSHSMGGLGVLVGAAAVLYLAFVPMIYRYSRVVWLHLDYVLTVRRHGDTAD